MPVRFEGACVVKTLQHTSLAEREYRLLRKMNHPNICVASCVEGVDLVMPYGGPDLLDVRPKDLRHAYAQIASAVAYLHTRGYAHLDLKPDNIVCDETQHVRLVDFGLVTDSAELRGTFGTRAYMAPEMWTGVTYDPRKTDVWSLGIVLFALLHDALPFHKAATGDKFYDAFVANGLPRRTEEAWMRAVFETTLRVDPVQRGTAADVAAAVIEEAPTAKRVKM